MTKSLSDILSVLTSPAPPAASPPPPTPPLPPPPLEMPEMIELPPAPPPPHLPSPSPPPQEPAPSTRSQTRLSGGRHTPEQREELPERPAPPSELIKEMQRKIDTQYKKYPNHEKTPPRPCLPAAPPPPERNNSLGRVKSAPGSPGHKRRIVIRATRTPSPCQAALETHKLKVSGKEFPIASFLHY